MTAIAEPSRTAPPPAMAFALTAFLSAGLVFLVQPMVGKLILPLLGGSPSVWNASIAFFQAALLAGYAYAHALQRLPSLRRQAMVHAAVLAVAALALPLRVNMLFGQPTSEHPALWLLGALAVSIGAPFAALSATAPLVQAWHARAFPDREPYHLYAASNLGSLVALLAYPLLVEPTLPVRVQTAGWSLGYVAFAILIGALAFRVARGAAVADPADPAPEAAPIGWKDRLTWLALAAIPSSLMLGVTTYIATDVASAPFIWVGPLALYLITFIVAFQAKPAVPPRAALFLQAILLPVCAAILPFDTFNLPLQVAVHLATFFLTALVCHQALVARRPAASRLTEFYLWMSAGGVLGGAFNAFVAPVVFNDTYEYPLVLALAALARPAGWEARALWRWAIFFVGCAAVVAAPVVMLKSGVDLTVQLLIGAAVACAFLSRAKALFVFALVVLISLASRAAADRLEVRGEWRSFFGVVRVTELRIPGYNGPVHMLAHGTTLHGAQATHPDYDCRPLVYYAPETPIGQVFLTLRDQRPGMQIGAVGMGTGAVSAYVRPTDHMTVFEIDPMMVRLANDKRQFTYTTACAESPLSYVIGDARLTLAKEPSGKFDLLLIDAFSSDAVPAHLLTVQAMKIYLDKLKPDGVVIMHLSNRHLDLRAPTQAIVKAAGGVALEQRHSKDPSTPALWESPEDVIIVARNAKALATFQADPRWSAPKNRPVKPWTDDYTNLPGALYAQLRENWGWDR